MRNNTCRKCHAPVRWLVTNNGKRTMLDESPSADGTVAIVAINGASGPAHELAVAVKDSEVPDKGVPLLEILRASGVPLHTVHFFTCSARHGGEGA